MDKFYSVKGKYIGSKSAVDLSGHALPGSLGRLAVEGGLLLQQQEEPEEESSSVLEECLTLGISDNMPGLLLALGLPVSAEGLAIAATLTPWNELFDLPRYGNPFTRIEVNEGFTEVKLYGGSEIIIKDELFKKTNASPGYLTSVVDTGCIVVLGDVVFGFMEEGVDPVLVEVVLPGLIEAGEGCFYGCASLVSLDLSALQTAGDYCFYGCTSLVSPDLSALQTAGDGCFLSCTSLVSSDLSALQTAGDECFSGCASLVSPDLSALQTAGDYCFSGCASLVSPDLSALQTAGNQCFYGCTSYININLPSLTTLGSTTGYDEVFAGIVGNAEITLTIPEALMYCNEESSTPGPDGDIQYLIDNNISVIINGNEESSSLEEESSSLEEESSSLEEESSSLEEESSSLPEPALILGFDSNGAIEASVEDWNAIFNLPAKGTPFTNVEERGNDIYLWGGSNITLKAGLFVDSGWGDRLISIVDEGGWVVAVDCEEVLESEESNRWEMATPFYHVIQGDESESSNLEVACINLEEVVFPGLIEAKNQCFYGCTSLVSPDLSALQTAGDYCFQSCTSLVSPDLSALQTAGNQCFYGCTSYININLPSLTALGSTTGYDNVFEGIINKAEITLTIPEALMYCNEESSTPGPDGDIQYLIDNNTLVTIILSYEGLVTVGEFGEPADNFGWEEGSFGSYSPEDSEYTSECVGILYVDPKVYVEGVNCMKVTIDGTEFINGSYDGEYTAETSFPCLSNPFPATGETCVVKFDVGTTPPL